MVDLKKYWVGSTGPFTYDADVALPDRGTNLPAGVTNQSTLITTGQLNVATAPTAAGEILRFEDIGGALPGVSQPDLTGNSYTILDSDYIVLIDDDDADVTGTVVVALPAAASSLRRVLYIKKIGSSFNVQLDGNGAELIDEQATVDIVGQYDCACIFCDGTGWWVI